MRLRASVVDTPVNDPVTLSLTTAYACEAGQALRSQGGHWPLMRSGTEQPLAPVPAEAGSAAGTDGFLCPHLEARARVALPLGEAVAPSEVHVSAEAELSVLTAPPGK